MYVKSKVIMLPTNEKANNICKGIELANNNALKLFQTILPATINNWQPNHLYFLSNEKAKEGDFVYNSSTETIQRVGKNVGGAEFEMHCINPYESDITPGEMCTKVSNNYSQYLSKIIATTDTSLRVSRVNSHPNSIWKIDGALLPQPSKGFIEKYIKMYNQGNPIEEVMIEYEADPKYIHDAQLGDIENFDKKIKISQDNTITIKPIKDSWSLQEIEKIKAGLKEIQSIASTLTTGNVVHRKNNIKLLTSILLENL